MRRSLFLIAALALVAAACSSSGDDAAGSTSTTGTAAAGVTTTAAPTQSESTEAPDDEGGSSPTLTAAPGWSVTVLGSGAKPVIALDGAGSPGVAWLFESIGEGFIAYASEAGAWEQQNLIEGYFYGPIDLAFGPDGGAQIVYHDHQATSFHPDLGDLARIRLDGGVWAPDTAADDGHDGWDSTVVIGADGTVHAAGVDPSQFGSQEGVEYYRDTGDGWEVTAIGSGPIPYQYNVSLALDTEDSPALTYYNPDDGDLIYARLDGDWVLETVASDGDVGKYSSLAHDGQGRPAITFFEQNSSSGGNILFAFKQEAAWVVETVGSLSAFSEDNARRNSSLAFDGEGRAHVVFSDTTGVWYSVRGDAGWETEQIVTADQTLGQLVSLVLDADDTPHLVLYEFDSNPADGTIVYLTTS